MTPLRIASLLAACCAALLLTALPALAHPHILRASDRKEVSRDELLRDLKSARVIFFGELHDQVGHHEAQLSLLRTLHGAGLPLAVGLEMFRRDSQLALDRWVSGRADLPEFLGEYNSNWSMWEKYAGIFEFARARRVTLLGLNIPRELSSKVARSGFASLPAKQRQALGDVKCVVDPAYGSFIRKAMGGHGGHGEQYLFFCEAQLLWDTMMARHLAEFLKADPQRRVVVLAGSGHAWKFGIPRQLLEQMSISFRVILPEVGGRVTRADISPEVTDYLWLDEGPDGWSF